MSKLFICIASILLNCVAFHADGAELATLSEAGAVDEFSGNSDEFIWRVFIDTVKPLAGKNNRATFEAWASDRDTYDLKKWPTELKPLDFHPSVQAALKIEARLRLMANGIDVRCEAPKGAAAGGFPMGADNEYCIAEQVARNRPMFDYINSNGLDSVAGLKEAFRNGVSVDMPKAAVAIKGDWVPFEALLQWIPNLKSADDIKKNYYTVSQSGRGYALVSMHVASRQNPNWVWGTFEHQLTPGRCDYIGCSDTFGSTDPIAPNKTTFNSTYPPCIKSGKLLQLMQSQALENQWQNYCLKSTQVAFTRSDGTPYLLGNSVIEAVFGNGTTSASSCISCHYYASFNADGHVPGAAQNMLPFNPTGMPLGQVLQNAKSYSFMWGVVQAK